MSAVFHCRRRFNPVPPIHMSLEQEGDLSAAAVRNKLCPADGAAAVDEKSHELEAERKQQ